MAIPIITVEVTVEQNPIKQLQRKLLDIKNYATMIPPSVWEKVDAYIANVVRTNWDALSDGHQLKATTIDIKTQEKKYGLPRPVTNTEERVAKYITKYGKRTGFFRDEVLGSMMSNAPIGTKDIIVKYMDRSRMGSSLYWGIDLTQFVPAEWTGEPYPMSTFRDVHDAVSIGSEALIAISVDDVVNIFSILLDDYIFPTIAAILSGSGESAGSGVVPF